MSNQDSILPQLPSSLSGAAKYLHGHTGALIAAAAVFALVAGIGAATSYLRDPPESTATSQSVAPVDTLAQLKDYTRSIGAEPPAHAPPAGKMLPDVNTMIERLAARLETAPDDVKGWRMLGWSYFNTAHYDKAASAYAKAIELDPSSADLKALHEEAKAKSSGNAGSETTATSPKVAAGPSATGPAAADVARMEAMPQQDRDAAIRAMVDGLTDRLERSPRDVDGWTRLMRSRVVLGEKEVAATALRKALDVFKDDTAASARIKAAAIELGLKAN
jgi:cytochrome c-type biogenesis protein CcmH/NrfG